MGLIFVEFVIAETDVEVLNKKILMVMVQKVRPFYIKIQCFLYYRLEQLFDTLVINSDTGSE